MPFAKVFADRAAKDTANITSLAMGTAIRVAGKVRARAIGQIRTGKAFDYRHYISEQLQPIIGATMLAAHLAGYRRFNLVVNQEPILHKQLAEGRIRLEGSKVKRNPTLSLAGIETALNVLKRQAGLDFESLQKKYDTFALKIANRFSDEIDDELRGTLQELIQNGAHVKEAIEVIGNKFDSLGITPAHSGEIETIFRTQTQLAFGAGKYQAEQAPEIQEILWGYKYTAVGDDRTRESHLLLDGTTLPKNDPFWQRFYPPNGYNCRCQAIPIFEQRQVVAPPPTLEDGHTPLEPDKGFDFNPGVVFASAT